MKKICWILFLTFLCSCAAPLKKKLSDDLPRFNGTITPIKIAVVPQHKPAKGTFILSVEDKDKSFTMKGSFSLSNIGDSLIWEMKVFEVTANLTRVTFDPPLTDMRYLIDKNMNIVEKEISFPVLEKNKRMPREGTKEYNELMGFPEMIETFKDILFLKKTTLVTGNHIYLSNAVIVIKGWAYYKDRKVLVGSIADQTTFTEQDIANALASNPQTADLTEQQQILAKPIGYVVYDSETFLLLLFDMEGTIPQGVKIGDLSGKIKFSGKFRFTLAFDLK